MLTLKVLEGGQECLCFVSRQILPSQSSDESTLLRDVPGTVLDVPPDHIDFGFAFAHGAS
ncbi:hypothetical protein [Methylobacterium platani]|nr:hypothetical protein [Methylobacterium platani]